MLSRPRRAPKIAGKRNRNKHTLERGSKGCMHIKKLAGITDKALLSHRVRRETEPTI